MAVVHLDGVSEGEFLTGCQPIECLAARIEGPVDLGQLQGVAVGGGDREQGLDLVVGERETAAHPRDGNRLHRRGHQIGGVDIVQAHAAGSGEGGVGLGEAGGADGGVEGAGLAGQRRVVGDQHRRAGGNDSA